MEKKKALQEFRRFVQLEKNKRQGAFFFSLLPDEGHIFQEEMRYLHKIFDEEENLLTPFTPLEKMVIFYDELSDEQLACYFSLIPFFQSLKNAGKDIQEELALEKYLYYGYLYLLEAANLWEEKSPEQAFETIKTLYDQFNLVLKGKKKEEGKCFMLSLLDSMGIAYPELMQSILSYMNQKGISPYSSSWSQIRSGDFSYATLYVQKNARLLKKADLDMRKDYVSHAWRALPLVFDSLDERYERMSFRELLSQGKSEQVFLHLLPIKGIQSSAKQSITVDSFHEIKRIKAYGYGDQWTRSVWSLYEGTGDFLRIIYIYTESFMREYLKQSKRGRSIAQILRKTYKNTGDQPQNIVLMKKLLSDQAFEACIKAGVERYLEDYQVKAPEKEKKSRKPKLSQREKKQLELYEMDHEQPEQVFSLDKGKLAQAKKDMNYIVDLLHEEEIDYDSQRNHSVEVTPLMVEQKITVTEYESESAFSKQEADYLDLLLHEDWQQLKSFLDHQPVSEAILVKEINRKAIDLFGDILLEYEQGRFHIIEDYIDDIKNKIM